VTVAKNGGKLCMMIMYRNNATATEAAFDKWLSSNGLRRLSAFPPPTLAIIVIPITFMCDRS
jgi:hypothetical protein